MYDSYIHLLDIYIVFLIKHDSPISHYVSHSISDLSIYPFFLIFYLNIHSNNVLPKISTRFTRMARVSVHDSHNT